MDKKNYDKYLDLSRQRVQSFEKIKAQLEELTEKVQQSGISNNQQSLKDTEVDTANKWSKIMVGNARAKGHHAGYAEACFHMSELFGSLASFVDEELKRLQSLYDEILANVSEEDSAEASEEGDKEDDKDLFIEDTVDPLD